MLDRALETLPPAPSHPALGVIDSLLIVDSQAPSPPPDNVPCDSFGLSSYARCVFAVISWCCAHRTSLQRRPGVMRHIIIAAHCASDLLALPTCHRPMFGTVAPSVLQNITSSAEKLYVSFFRSEFGNSWHKQSAELLFNESLSSENHDSWTRHLHTTFQAGLKSNSPQDARVLYLTLKHLLSSSSPEVSDTWLNVAWRVPRSCE